MSDVKKLVEYSCLSESQKNLFALLDTMGITYTTYEHPAIFTIEEGDRLNLPDKIPGQHAKSLFLKNAAGELWLAVVCEHTRVDLKTLSEKLETKRFSFAKPEIMRDILGVVPGSVTPFALINDTGKKTKVVIDEDLARQAYCVFHPLVNTHSTVIKFTDLLHFLDRLGFQPYIVALA